MRRSKQLGKKERRPADNSVYKIERAARDRADDQARRVPWQLLLETRNQYVEMQEGEIRCGEGRHPQLFST